MTNLMSTSKEKLFEPAEDVGTTRCCNVRLLVKLIAVVVGLCALIVTVRILVPGRIIVTYDTTTWRVQHTIWSQSELQRKRLQLRNGKLKRSQNDHEKANTKTSLMFFEVMDLPHVQATATPSARPLAFSWTNYTTKVKSQEICIHGSWAFAAVATIETHAAMFDGYREGFSEQELIDCDDYSDGCKSGLLYSAFNYALFTGLLRSIKTSRYRNSREEYRYIGKESYCKYSGESWNYEKEDRSKIPNFKKLARDENVLADWVWKHGLVAFEMRLPYSLREYKSGVFDPSDCREDTYGSHFATIMGYGEENGTAYWLVKNSWGEGWGENGYFKLARGTNACGMRENVFGLLYSTPRLPAVMATASTTM